ASLNRRFAVLRFRMEEAEVPLEHLHEQVKERAEHGGAPWISWVALSTAILAVLAAIAGLLSGEHANEAMMNQIEASDQWNYYQAKSIKASVLTQRCRSPMRLTYRTSQSAIDTRKSRNKSNPKPSTRKPLRNQTFTSTKCSHAA